MSDRPGCYDECAGLLRSIVNRNPDGPVDVAIGVCPDGPIVMREGFPPFIVTCPHGVTYLLEPTSDQLAEWARNKTP